MLAFGTLTVQVAFETRVGPGEVALLPSWTSGEVWFRVTIGSVLFAFGKTVEVWFKGTIGTTLVVFGKITGTGNPVICAPVGRAAPSWLEDRMRVTSMGPSD
jgi:hypothetical protein